MPVLVIGGIEVAWLAAAVLALILVLALDQFAHWISYLFPSFSVPVLGSLRSRIIGAINGSISLVWSASKASYAYLVHIFNDPIVLFTHFINIIHATFAEVVASLTWLKNTAIPAATRAITSAYAAADAQVHAYAAALGSNIETDLRNGDATVHAFAAAAAGSVETDARNLYSQAIAAVNSSAATIEGDLKAGDAAVTSWATAAIANVESDARNLYSQGVAYTNGAVAAATSTASSLFTQAERDAINAANAAESAAINIVNGALAVDLPGVWPAVVAGVDGIGVAAAGGFADVQQLLGAIPRVQPTTVAGAAAAALAGVSALSKLAEDCTIPNCRNLSQIGRDLQALFGVVEDAGFLAFVAEMLTQPQQAADDAMSIIVPVLNDTADAAKSLIGI